MLMLFNEIIYCCLRNFDGKYLLHREGDVIAFHPDTDVFDFIHSLVATEKRSDL